jgi:hypothetical protein
VELRRPHLHHEPIFRYMHMQWRLNWMYRTANYRQRPGRFRMEKKACRHGGADFNLEPCSCRSEPPKSGLGEGDEVNLDRDFR